MAEKSGAQISKKAFIQSLVILLALMIAAGIMTLVIPAGLYDRIDQEGRQVIDTSSFRYVPQPDYPIWRWFTSPLEVFTIGPDKMTIIMLSLFILLVGSSFGVMDKSGVLRSILGHLVKTFGSRKYVLLFMVSLFFMVLGGFFGIIEEMIPLVPVIIGLSYALGWDSLVGLGMSILATNMGFSAAIANPFTIGIAQKIAGLPSFSGAWFRTIVFAAFYIVFFLFLSRYARKIEKNPEKSLVYVEEKKEREKYRGYDLAELEMENPRMRSARLCMTIILGLIIFTFFAGSFITALADLALPIVGLLFVIGGVATGVISGMGWKNVGKAMLEGLTGIAPGILLILMAASVKYIAYTGGIMDTILHSAAQAFEGVSPLGGALAIFVIALIIEIFISSGSAKAFLIMPILLPLSDMVGLTRQMAVTAYCFGDGFSNMAYPTNAMLLIVLGLTVVGYPKWIRWTARLWLYVLVLSVIFLTIGVAINLGPF